MTVLFPIGNMLGIRLLHQTLHIAPAPAVIPLAMDAAWVLQQHRGLGREASVLQSVAEAGVEGPVRETLRVALSHRPVLRALAPHAEGLAVRAGLADLVTEMRSVVQDLHENPVPWWFGARYPFQRGRASISLFQGALAIGGLTALRWLLAVRETLGSGSFADLGFSFEPHLLWLPDELSQTVLLNGAGLVSLSISQVLEVNRHQEEEPSVSIRALVPYLPGNACFIVGHAETPDCASLWRLWADQKISGQMLALQVGKRYQTVRGVKNIESKGALKILHLEDGTERELAEEQKLTKPLNHQVSRAFGLFAHQIRPGDASNKGEIANPFMTGMSAPWLTFDYSTGGMMTTLVWEPLAGIEGLRVFVRGGPHMETGFYDQHMRRLNAEFLPDGVHEFFHSVIERLKRQVEGVAPKTTHTPPPQRHFISSPVPETPLVIESSEPSDPARDPTQPLDEVELQEAIKPMDTEEREAIRTAYGHTLVAIPIPSEEDPSKS